MTDPWNPTNPPPPTRQVPWVGGPYTEPVPQVPGPAAEQTIGPTGPPGPPPPYLPLPPDTASGGAPLPPPPGAGGRRGLTPFTIVALTLGAVVLVASLAVLVSKVLITTDDPATTTTASTITTTTTTAPTTVAPPTPPPGPTTAGPVTAGPDMSGYLTATPGADFASTHDVRTLPDGLFCRNLRALGYSYPAAIDYWRQYGQPDRMDADRNGIPCETVYPRSDVVAYWGGSTFTPSSQSSFIWDQPPGLLCRDLKARGFDVVAAIDYYLNWGRPDRMDADHNGIPCETVYPDAAAVWYGNGD